MTSVSSVVKIRTVKPLTLHLLILSVCSVCSVVPSSAELRAGAATANITPLMGVPLDGTIMQIGPAKHVHDELHARCLVLDDGTTRIAFAVVDNTMISREIHDQAKALIEEHTGIPPANVLISATHTHSTPRAMVGLKDDPLHKDYLTYLATRISEGVRRAHHNLAPARIGWGGFEEPRYVKNRRWFTEGAEKVTNPFGEKGEKVRMNPGRTGLIKPAGPVDPEVFLLSVQHEDGRPLALLANYGLHYVGGIPGGTVSADYYGAFCKRLEESLNTDNQDPPFVAMMSNGTSGDVNANDVTAPREKFAPYERMNLIARDLADGVLEALQKIEHRDDLTLAAATRDLTLGVRKPDAARIAWAKSTTVSGVPKLRLTRPQVYAREALQLADYPDTLSIPLQVLRIGELAIATSPCETFAETGLAIKEESPFAATFVVELANGYAGYLPTPQQHEWGGYETWPARSSLLEVNAEPKIRTTLLDLLNQLDTP